MKFCKTFLAPNSIRSLPAWECGLKSQQLNPLDLGGMVTPCVGVWIEIVANMQGQNALQVTPCVGVWIEIGMYNDNNNAIKSLPAWECGLKFCEKISVCVWR